MVLTRVRVMVAMVLAMVALVALPLLVSAGTVTSERVIFGEPYGTVRLDGRDYTEPFPGVFVPLKSFDQMCEDARNLHGRFDYDTAVGYPVKAWNGEWYLTCTD